MPTIENNNSNNEWDFIIRPKRAWWDLGLAEIWKYRDLIILWVRREFVALYKQTLLGPLWHVIPIVISSGVFSLVFSGVAKIPTDGMPPFLFYMAGNTLWGFFSSCVNATSNTFGINAGIFGKVHFPRMCMPIALVVSQLIAFGVRFGVFLGFWVYFLIASSFVHPNIWMLLLPVQLLVVSGMGMALGIIVSSVTTKYRDLQQLLSVGLQLIMYASPIIYPLSQVPGSLRWILLLNPLAPVFETFRLGFLGVSTIGPAYLLYSAGFTIVALFISLLLFNNAEQTFLDTV